MPFWPKDRRAVIEILEERKRRNDPESKEWHWSEQKIREIERLPKSRLIIAIAGLILTAIGLVLVL